MKDDIESSRRDYIKITVCIKKKKKKPNRVSYDSMTVWKEDARQMIDGGFFGVSACGRPAHWLPPAPVRGRGDEIGCASSPAVLERRRSLQLSSVGSCEPRKKPCDPSQTRRRSRIRLKPPSIQLENASLAAQTLDMATSILGVSQRLYQCAKVARGVTPGCFSLRQFLQVLHKHCRVQSFSCCVVWKCIYICCFHHGVKA